MESARVLSIQQHVPLVSVIIPCFNREQYIRETIESVFSQTWRNIELIVVDDGCTDGSRNILESFGDRIVLLEHPGRVNRGQSAALNLGLRASRGEFISILDSDDLFTPDKLAKQLGFLKDNPDLGLVYSNGNAVDSEGKFIHAIYPPDHRSPMTPEEILLDCCINLPSNSMVRRTVFETAGMFDETLRSAQDHDMVLRIVEVTRVGYLPDCLWFYRRHGGSISNTRTAERWRNGFVILEKACRRYPYSRVARNRRRAILNFRLGQCYLNERSFLKAAFHLLKAGLLDPARSLQVILGREAVTAPQ